MSSFDRGIPARRRFGAVGALAVALALGACSVQPLYGPSNFAGGSEVQSTLTRISVAPVDDRVGQQVRNRVIFQMTGGKAISDPLYHMTLTVTSREAGLGVTVTEASPIYSVTVQATFTVKRVGTDEVLVTGTSRANASYNYVNQIYANTRAKLDAENRAAEQVGNEIAVRVAAAIAAGS
ncbi:MAG TPA: LPS assembly lipoprotein LptE [Bauldia sp.]|nr:LPS assembly lipoprotein LptE [Bauldia sp.]